MCKRNISLISILWLLSFLSVAQTLNVDIVGGLKTATPIVIVPFVSPSGTSLPVNISDIITNDFNRSGKFRTLPKRDLVAKPTQGSLIKFATWRLLKQDYMVLGRIMAAAHDKVQVEYELWDINKQQSLLHQRMPAVSVHHLRSLAHQIADLLYQKITGTRGAFWTHIAYITVVGTGKHRTYSLMVADSDGHNPQVVVRSHSALLTPRWSPDGGKIAYVSFESGNSAIYVQNLASGKRTLISGRKGINGAPAWSPDGSKMAMSLSYTGSPQIYVMALATRKTTRLTHSLSVNTEPAWSPDGNSLYFTSDRSGRPQIYKIPAAGGKPMRITFQGHKNYECNVSEDGSELAMVQAAGSIFRIAIMDLGGSAKVRYVSPGPLDESPSFAPNGSMLLYAASSGQYGVLYATSSDGMVRQRLVLAHGDVREPTWGPYRHGHH